jgi:hypothetical protein
MCSIYPKNQVQSTAVPAVVDVLVARRLWTFYAAAHTPSNNVTSCELGRKMEVLMSRESAASDCRSLPFSSLNHSKRSGSRYSHHLGVVDMDD